MINNRIFTTTTALSHSHERVRDRISGYYSFLTPLFNCAKRTDDINMVSSSETSAPFDTRHDHPRDPSIASPRYESSNSPLLKLPAELRNRVYHFALTTSKGLYLDRSNPARFLDADAKAEYKKRKTINILKFTCHQLYKETAGIEIKFNRVEFLGPHQSPGPAQAFNDFLSRCTATRARLLREVTLWFPDRDALSFGNCVESEAVLLPVVEFCRNHPLVNLRYMPQHFEFSATNPDCSIMIGVWLSLEFRGKDLWPSSKPIVVVRPMAMAVCKALSGYTKRRLT
jgi:hypothetical protein